MGCHSIVRLCEAIGVSRSGFNSWRKRTPSERDKQNATVLADIRRIHADVMKTYGSPRMHVELIAQGHRVSLGRVERIMRRHKIRARRYTRLKHPNDPQLSRITVSNVLDRQFYAVAPNKKWVSDITLIETREGWLHLAIVLDLYSRAIVGWSMSAKPAAQLVCDALSMAVEQRVKVSGALVHSDQGTQYTSKVYCNALEQHGLKSSMSRKGECHDNAVAESFFKTLKGELIDGFIYRTRNEARQEIFKYIELFYNRKRRHSTIGYRAPLEYETIMSAA